MATKEIETPLSPEEAAALGLGSAPKKETETPLSPEEAAALGLTPPPSAAPAPAPAPKPSVGEAAGRGAAQGATLFMGDEVAGALDASAKVTQRFANRVQDARTSGHVTDLFANPVVESRKVMNDYRETRDTERHRNAAAAEAHPVVYGVSQVAGGLPAAIATAGTTSAAPAITGALTGLAGSDAELTPDKATLSSVENAALAAGTGAVLNKAGVKLGTMGGVAPKLVMPAMGALAAAEGDKIGMSDADRVSAGVSAGLAVPGLVTDALESRAARFRSAAEPAKEQVATRLTNADTKEDAASLKSYEKDKKGAIGEVRSKENEAFAIQQAEARRQADIADVKQKIEQLQSRKDLTAQEEKALAEYKARAFEQDKAERLSKLSSEERAVLAQKEAIEGQRAVKEYQAKHKGANKNYMQQIGAWDDEIRAQQLVRARRQAEIDNSAKGVADAEQALKDLDASVGGHRAQAFKEAATRMAQYPDIVGEALPDRYNPVKEKIAESYKRNSDNIIVDPDVAAQNYRALKEYELRKALDAAKAGHEQVKAAPFDEEQAVRDILRKKGSRVSKNEAYQLAQKLGLDPGDFGSFEVVPPKGGFKLVESAPPTPTTMPSPVDKRLSGIAAKKEAVQGAVPTTKPSREEILRAAGVPERPDPEAMRLNELLKRQSELENPTAKPEPARQSEEDILKGVGLDKYAPPSASKLPVQERVQARVNRLVPKAREAITWEALKGFLSGAGVGLGGHATGIPFADTLGPVAPVAGTFLGARHAVKTLTALNEKGEFSNPTQAAATYEALARVFDKVPSLRQKYLQGFKEGLRPLEIAFFIKHDPELAKALDHESGSNR